MASSRSDSSVRFVSRSISRTLTETPERAEECFRNESHIGEQSPSDMYVGGFRMYECGHCGIKYRSNEPKSS